MSIENDLVSYSRAGDAFHYRWAARRCLQLVYPKSTLQHVVIEGSKESKLAGEYAIDVSEYSKLADSDLQEIAYYQLKHTTKRTDQPFNLSDLRDTIIDFAKRYVEQSKTAGSVSPKSVIRFCIVTNRPISQTFKDGVTALALGQKGNAGFLKTIKKYTKLNQKDLTAFCASLTLADGEGNYDAQRDQLRAELAQLLAGTVDDPKINNIIALVQEKVLAANRIVNREEVLFRLGATSERQLFPAPPEFEKLDSVIPRKQHETLRDQIIDATDNIIIHAAGGVGKSVFARQIKESLLPGSFGIVYDCFGGGRYRNRSEPRHRHRDALIQIANELASQQLCSPFIAPSTALENEILVGFLTRIKTAADLLKQANPGAVLVIVIDAADNAEMAAQEISEACFVHELLREPMPEGCRLVALCRTERVDLLDPSASVLKIELEAFSQEETLAHLRSKYSEASEAEGLEFHRLTNNGNPRVQANALGLKRATIAQTLDDLGPFGTTIEKQIATQLDSAVSSVKDKLPREYQKHIDAICMGLATLPPFVPLKVLAKAAGVDEAHVKSFLADLGRPIWLSDTSVQFRDEPTETWFRTTYSATEAQIASYIKILEPWASESSYVAQTLPILFLNAGKYDELVNLALSDDLLPKENRIDERNVRVYRLQFAFKAALKLKHYADAIKLALRAGEEVAGDKRQLKILRKNVDLIAPLQDEQKVQELAYKGLLRGRWDGSENVYSAALLSSVVDFQGEARGYLRAAFNWLDLYIKSRDKTQKAHSEDKLKDEQIVELVFAGFNIENLERVANFILSWTPAEVIYRVSRTFFRRLIDSKKFEPIMAISLLDHPKKSLGYQYLMMAIAQELLTVGQFPPAKATAKCLNLLVSKSTQIPVPIIEYKDTTREGLISLLEACAANKNSKVKILKALKKYFPLRGSLSVSRDFPDGERGVYLRSVALRCILENNPAPKSDDLLPTEYLPKKVKTAKSKRAMSASNHQEITEFKETVETLLPWHMVRSVLMVNGTVDLFTSLTEAKEMSKTARGQRYRERDPLLYDISGICFDILTLFRPENPDQLEQYYTEYVKDNQLVKIQHSVEAVRSAMRWEHLSPLRRRLEVSARELVDSNNSDGPEEQAEWYIDLARAVLAASREDAAAYFNKAIEVVSKFGDELVQRWEAMVDLAWRSAHQGATSPEIAYRFMRIAELVGDNVDREKHWNRNAAIRASVRLSPTSALTTLGRWRDREIGWLDRQIVALAEELVDANIISPQVGWSLSAYYEEYGLEDFAYLCMEKDDSLERRQKILDTTVRDLRLNETSEWDWEKLQKAAGQYGLNEAELNVAHAFADDTTEKKSKASYAPGNLKQVETPIEWAGVFDGLDLVTADGLHQAIQRFEAEPPGTRNRYSFWEEVYNRIDESAANSFLKMLVNAELVYRYDIQTALASIPNDWKQKISIQQDWNKIIEQVGKRYALDFTSQWGLEYFMEKIGAREEVMPSLRKGILEGLANNFGLVDAGTFFGFGQLASPLISPTEAIELLDFGLTRFEMHLPPDYADGSWSAWLEPPKEITMAFSGFIWSNLGSPHADIRWRAVHSVRRLAQMGCEAEIDSLIKWMEKGTVDAFGSHNFPFYYLHAQLYLLIALTRVSLDTPEVIKKHAEAFLKMGVPDSIPHLLIQFYASQIAINLEKAFPETYAAEALLKLKQVGVSQLPVEHIEYFSKDKTSFWHAKGEVDTTLKHYHGWDFDSYWFDPLGKLFGINEHQVAELATQVIINEWNIKNDGSYDGDPRVRLWNSSRDQQLTSHDHGSYPQVDRFSFYLSYHSMFVVAARLLEKMPILIRRHSTDVEDPIEDPLNEWLDRHLLTRRDGRWLADRRDPVPFLLPEWAHKSVTDNWREEISDAEFLKVLVEERDGQRWLNVAGNWDENHADCLESLYISSALISPETSQSLLDAVSTLSDPQDFHLPEHQENDEDIDLPPFKLQGWIEQGYSQSGLDSFDPHGGGIRFPPYKVVNKITEALGLIADDEYRNWIVRDTSKLSLKSDIWRTKQPRRGEESARYGDRLSASTAILKQLCLATNCELVFRIQIRRNFSYRSSRRKEDDGYKPPHIKVYILSPDGSLRDAKTRYQIG
ncbi:MAG: hypothetical protein JNM55_13350 [Anaerolineales bacterium]|nr:hypothetical protein [Anaerolineales bacterium]